MLASLRLLPPVKMATNVWLGATFVFPFTHRKHSIYCRKDHQQEEDEAKEEREIRLMIQGKSHFTRPLI